MTDSVILKKAKVVKNDLCFFGFGVHTPVEKISCIVIRLLRKTLFIYAFRIMILPSIKILLISQ